MATIKEDIVLKYQVTKDGDVVDTSFAQGDKVDVISKWTNHYLIKDGDGHFYNIPKAHLNE